MKDSLDVLSKSRGKEKLKGQVVSLGLVPNIGTEGSRSGQRTCSKWDYGQRLSKLTHCKENSMSFLEKFQTKKSQHQGPKTLMCPFKTLRIGPWLTHGKAKVYILIPSKSHQVPSKPGIIFVTHGPSLWDLTLVVREKWFGW